MGLSIELLTDEQFDKLPYKEAPISLGVADTKNGKAYVRYVANEELQKYLINHELEHLLGEDRDEIHHGGEGVYYKGFGNVFQGLGQMFQGAGASIGGAARSVGQAASGAGRSVMNMFGGQQPQTATNPVSNLGQAFSQGAQKSTPSQLSYSQLNASPTVGHQIGVNLPTSQPKMFGPPSADPFNKIPQTPRTTVSTKPQTPQFTPPTANSMAPLNQFVGAISNMRPQAPTVSSPMPQTPPSTPPVNQTAPPAQTGGALGQFGIKNPAQTALGAGLQGIGQFGIQTPNIPDIDQLPSVNRLRSFNFKSVGELDPALEQAINNDFQRIEQQETQQMIARYKSLRPGADVESDSNFKRDLLELQRMQGQRRADALAKYRFEMIERNLQLSQAELGQLQEMAAMDVRMIMEQMSLDYADAIKFKDTFSRLGDTLINEGLGIGQKKEEVPQEETNG